MATHTLAVRNIGNVTETGAPLYPVDEICFVILTASSNAAVA
jgi:hypothetical protein